MKLKREDFKRMYDAACENEWKPKLLRWYGDKFAVGDEVEVKESEYRLMRTASNTTQRELLDDIFGKENSITDKVKTVEDAIKLLGEADKEVVELRLLQKAKSKNIAFQSLVVVIKALNEGWYPNWDNSDYKWYPWFEMKNNKPSLNYVYDYCGYSNVSARLCFKTEELAGYCVKQFIDIYRDYMK